MLSFSCLLLVMWRARLTLVFSLIVQSAVLSRNLSPCCLQQALQRLKISKDFLYRTGDSTSHCPWIWLTSELQTCISKYASMYLSYFCSSSDLLKILVLYIAECSLVLYIAECGLHSQIRQIAENVCSWVIYRALRSIVPLPYLYKPRVCWAENMTLSSGYAYRPFGIPF